MNYKIENTKYELKGLTKFKKQLKKAVKQGKDINKLIYVLNFLANGVPLESKYKDHALVNDKYYKDCRECHIEPDWLMVWEQNDTKLTLLFLQTGTHADVFG